MPDAPQRVNAFYVALAYVALALGVIGAFLPLLPTTPFLLLAAWAAARGSPRLHRWIIEHPRFGPPLAAWERNRAVATSAKWLACGLMSLSWLIMYTRVDGWIVPTLTGVLFVCVGGYLVSRPTP